MQVKTNKKSIFSPQNFHVNPKLDIFEENEKLWFSYCVVLFVVLWVFDWAAFKKQKYPKKRQTVKLCLRLPGLRRARTRRRSALSLLRPLMKWSRCLRIFTPDQSVCQKVNYHQWRQFLLIEWELSWICVSSQLPRCDRDFCSQTFSPQERLSSTPDTNTFWWSARCAAGLAPLCTSCCQSQDPVVVVVWITALFHVVFSSKL